MAEEFKWEKKDIWSPSGAHNVVPDFELPYWTSQAGGSWSTTEPGSVATETQASDQTNNQVGGSSNQPVYGPPAPTFNENPSPPAGTVTKRNDKEGRFSLVFFEDDPTPDDPQTGRSHWIFDSSDKTYRPITSYPQLENFIVSRGGVGAQEAMKYAINLDSASIRDNTLGWKGEFLGIDYAPKEDGTLPYYDNPNLTNEMLESKYGTTARNIEDERINSQRIAQALFVVASKGGISQSILSRIEDSKDNLLAKYTAAMVYGGYDMYEVMQDVKIQELAKSDPNYAGKKAISETMKRDTYVNTPEYNEVAQDPNLRVSVEEYADIQNILRGKLSLMDDSLFQELAPTFDWTDPANQAKLDDIQAAWFDLSLAQNKAGTEQAKAIADDEFQRSIKNINKQYGLNLSTNVETAWGQLNSMSENMSKSGLAGSGIEREAQDRIIADIRKSDELLREGKITDEEAKTREYLLNYADEQQMSDIINRLNEEDASAGISPNEFRSKKWGLTPSEETLAWFDPDALAKRFPNLSAKEIELMRGQLLDKNNRFRSNLYRQAIGNEFETGRSKQSFQEQEAMARSAEEAARKSQQFDSSLSSWKSPETIINSNNKGSESQGGVDYKPFVQTADTTPTDQAYARTDAVTKMLQDAAAGRSGTGGVTKPQTPQFDLSTIGQGNTGRSYTPPTVTPPKPPSPPPLSGSQDRLKQVKIKHSSGGEQTVMQGDFDDYWKNQAGWSRV